MSKKEGKEDHEDPGRLREVRIGMRIELDPKANFYAAYAIVEIDGAIQRTYLISTVVSGLAENRPELFESWKELCQQFVVATATEAKQASEDWLAGLN